MHFHRKHVRERMKLQFSVKVRCSSVRLVKAYYFTTLAEFPCFSFLICVIFLISMCLLLIHFLVNVCCFRNLSVKTNMSELSHL